MSTTTDIILPAPGVHLNIPEHVYRKWPALCQSDLKYGPTMAHIRYGQENPKEQTTAMMLGSALDCALLTPADFLDKYAIGPEGNRGTKKWDDAQAKVGDAVTLLKPDEYKRVVGMAEALMTHPASKKLLAAPGDLQVSLLWIDEETGVLCKARLDKLCSTLPFVTDVKSSESAEPGSFQRTAFNMGYNRQGAWYLDGCAACNIPKDKFLLPVVEQDRPHPVAVYDMGAASLELGRIRNREKLREYALAQKTGVWPGFPKVVQPLEVPAWALKDIDVDSSFEVIE